MAAECVRRGGRLAIIAFDPMSPISSGALLGDRLRVDFNTVDEGVFYRSLARTGEDYTTLPSILELVGGAGFDHRAHASALRIVAQRGRRTRC